MSVLMKLMLIICNLINSGSGNVDGGKCCKNYPNLGACRPGVDDNPEKDGKCWVFCNNNECSGGGLCRQVGNGHVCHCRCY